MIQGFRPPILVATMLICGNFACSQVSLKKSEAVARNELTENPGHDDPQHDMSTAEPLVREAEETASETISPPVNISGSYLICAEAKAATATSPDATVYCGLREQVSNSKINLSSFASAVWTYQVGDASPITALKSELTASLDWHIAVMLRGSSLDEIQTAQKSIKFFLTVGDAAGNKFREMSSLSLNCDNLAGGTWVAVPGDSIYGTEAFCVQKYAASNIGAGSTSQAGVPTAQAGRRPWGNVTQSTALSACASLGTGYRLITNPEWMTLAANLANVGANWSGGSVGAGTLRRGHSDKDPDSACAANANDANAYVDKDCTGTRTGDFVERRTSKLSNGAVVWDIGGNLWNWVDYFNAADKPTPAEALYYEFSSITGSATTPKAHLVPLSSVQPWWNERWTSQQQGIGRMHPGTNGAGGAMLRGLFWDGGENAGAFSAGMFDNQLTANLAFGFRCTWQPK